MFPRPIGQASYFTQFAYRAFLPHCFVYLAASTSAVFVTSLRGSKDINTGNVFGWPSELKLVENYTAIFTQTEAIKYFMNSFLITLPSVGISIACLFGGLRACCLPVSFKLCLCFCVCSGKFCTVSNFNGSRARYVGSDWALQHNFWSVSISCGVSNGILHIIHAKFCKALPFDLIENARVEGVAEWQIFWYIIIPLVRPAIAALAVLIFTFVWNDFLSKCSKGEQVKPITAGVRALNGQFISNWHRLRQRLC